MKIIFLDVDGVLNHEHSPGWTGGHWLVLDTECIWNMNRILRETGAKIVLSSTWRLNDEGQAAVEECFPQGSIVGMTPVVRHRLRDVEPRSVEILAWMSDVWPYSNGWNGEKIDKLAVLDDDTDADLCDGSFFKTEWLGGGLTVEITDAIIHHLNAPLERTKNNGKP